MKRIIRLTESDLARIVRRIINEENTAPLGKPLGKPLGMCKVMKGGYPILKTPKLTGDPDNTHDDMFEGGTGKLETVQGEELPYYGDLNNGDTIFVLVIKEGKTGYTKKDYVSCTRETEKTGNVAAQNESYRRKRYRY